MVCSYRKTEVGAIELRVSKITLSLSNGYTDRQRSHRLLWLVACTGCSVYSPSLPRLPACLPSAVLHAIVARTSLTSMGLKSRSRVLPHVDRSVKDGTCPAFPPPSALPRLGTVAKLDPVRTGQPPASPQPGLPISRCRSRWLALHTATDRPLPYVPATRTARTDFICCRWTVPQPSVMPTLRSPAKRLMQINTGVLRHRTDR
jgi:hypothetical protein